MKTRLLALSALIILLLITASCCSAVVYVDRDAPGPRHDGRSWNTAYLKIQEGVTAATSGGEVWVADGTYVENIVMGVGVQLYGGFLGAEPDGHETDLSQRDFANHVTKIDGNKAGSCVTMAVNAVVDGFTITNGNGRFGGGVFCYSSSSTITNNTITGNSADGGGAVSCYYSSSTIRNNTITGNSADRGGAIHCYYSSPTITNNTITGNTASRYGGMVFLGHNNSSPRVSNNIIVGNTASYGGGICGDSSAHPVLSCNDVWGNTPDDYGGCVVGPGDISEDPLFVDPDGPDGDPATWGDNDYHLSAGSPCIDKGDSTTPGLPYQDIDADLRVCDGNGDAVAIADMGADEYRLEFESNKAPSDWFVPGWVWFSIPLVPQESADASDVLGFDCTNRVFSWNEIVRDLRYYPYDFTDLVVGRGYLARLAMDEEYQPIYAGAQPQLPFEWALPAAGWCWVGVPATQDIWCPDLRVKRNGVTRTPAQDRSAPDSWLNWNWIYWDPVRRSAKITSPFGADDTWLHPWYGYRVWVNEPNVTIIFP